VRRLQGEDPLRAVTIIVGSSLVRDHVRRALVRVRGDGSGCMGEARPGHANVHVETIHGYAADLAGPGLASRQLRTASDLVRERLVSRLVRARTGNGWYFAPVGELPGLPVALTRTLDDLREACVTPERFEAFAREAESPKLHDLAVLYRDYVASLAHAGLYDDASVRRGARCCVRAGRGRCGVPAHRGGTPPSLRPLRPSEMQLVAGGAAPRVAAVFVPDLATSHAGGVRGRAGPLRPPSAGGARLRGRRPAGCRRPEGAPRGWIISVPDDAQRREIAREIVLAARRCRFHEMVPLWLARATRLRAPSLAGGAQP
jgi:hypothetical protein